MNKLDRTTESQTLALKTSIAFTRAHRAFAVRMKESIGRMGLTINQFGVMEALYHGGPMNLSALALKLQCTPGNLTTVVDNLTKYGRAERVAINGDRRVYEIHLTAAGSELIKEGFPRHAHDIVEAMDILTSVEQAELKRLSKKLGEGLTAQVERNEEMK